MLTGIDGIHDGAFYAPPAEGSDQIVRLTAFVVAPNLTEAEIKRRLREQIDSSFLPRHVIRVPSLPRRENGKLEYEVF